MNAVGFLSARSVLEDLVPGDLPLEPVEDVSEMGWIAPAEFPVAVPEHEEYERWDGLA